MQVPVVKEECIRVDHPETHQKGAPLITPRGLGPRGLGPRGLVLLSGAEMPLTDEFTAELLSAPHESGQKGWAVPLGGC